MSSPCAEPINLSIPAARSLLLAAQGLATPPAYPAAKADVRAAVHRMGALQIDTISVVARSPYLVLWSRLGDYQPAWLDELLAEGALFEQWAHEASLLDVDDYPLHRRITLDRNGHQRHWLTAHPDDAARVLAHIREHGAVRSADFERTDGKKSGWWNWKPEKRALEALFAVGDLAIVRRERFQRVYDLRERVIPGWSDDDAPPAEVVRRALALRAARALGVVTHRWLPDYFRTPRPGAAAYLESLADAGDLVRARVDTIADPAYVHPDNLPLAEAAAAGTLASSVTTFLSPFDPVVWDRARAKALFDFDYRIECYTPAERRRYGYFTLPVLRRGALIGRLDAKAHRRDRRFEVKSLHLEEGIEASDDLVADLRDALRRCADWHQTPEIAVRTASRPGLAESLVF